MTWVLVDLVPFLAAAFGLGLLSGYAIWRWRRKIVQPEQWNELTNASQLARAELELLEQQHYSLQQTRDDLTDRLDTLGVELSSVQRELRSAKSRAGQYREERDAADVRVETLTFELTGLQERLSDTESGLERARAKIAELVVFEAESKQLKDELELRDHRLTDLEQALVHSESRSEQAASHLTSLQATLSSVRADLERERRNAEQFADSLRTAEERLASLDAAAARIPNLEASLDSALSNLDQSESRVAELDALLASTRFEREAAEARLAQLDDELRSAQHELAGLANLESQVELLSTELTQRDASVSQLRESFAEANMVQAELATAKAHVTELEAALEHQIVETDRLRDDLSSASANLIAERQWIDEPDEMGRELHAARARINLLLGQLGERTIVAHRARADLNVAHHRLAELEQALAENTTIVLDDNQHDRDRMRAELETAREHIEKLEFELADTDDAMLDLAAARERIAQLESLVHASRSDDRYRVRVAPVPEDRGGGDVGITRNSAQGDDLTVVTGIGTRIEELLHDRGFTKWEDLAALDEQTCSELVQLIDLPAPVDPESWARQARQLIARYPDPAERPDRQMYRRSTSRKDRVSGTS